MTDGITMTNAVIECILSRRATKYYDPAISLSDDQIRELVRIGTSAPTSFHMQNWRFIAVRTSEARLSSLGVLCGLGGGGRPRGVSHGLGDGTEVA